MTGRYVRYGTLKGGKVKGKNERPGRGKQRKSMKKDGEGDEKLNKYK